MPIVPVTEAQTGLEALVRQVATTGEALVISVHGIPMAELRPITPVPTPGRFAGAIHFSDDAFASLRDDEADAAGC